MMVHMTTTDIHHALLRQQPKKAVLKTEKFLLQEYHEELIDYLVYCPVCGMFVCYMTEHNAHKDYSYCPRCGQKIEWEDVDYEQTNAPSSINNP